MRKLLLVILLSFLSTTCYAKITQVSTIVAFDGSGGSSQTQSVTIDANDNYLLVSASGWECSGGTYVVTGVTFNGDALTQLKADHRQNGGCGSPVEFWGIANPDVGTHDVTVTFTGSMGGIYGNSIPLRGVRSTGQPEATAEYPFTLCSDPISTNITTLTNYSWVIDYFSSDATPPGAVGSGQVEFVTDEHSYKELAVAGATSMSWAFTGCEGGNQILISLAPAPDSSDKMFQVFE